MRISKLLSGGCAAALLLGSLAVRAQDNPDQAAARAALMNKLNGLNAHASPPTNPSTPPATVTPPSGMAAAPSSPPAKPPMTTVAPPAVETQAAFAPVGEPDNSAQATARATLMNKLGGMSAPPSTSANQTMTPATPPPPAQTQSAFTPTPSETMPVSGSASDNAAQAAARAALMEKTGELNAQQAQAANPGLAPMVMKPSNAPAGQPAQTAETQTASPPRVTLAPAKAQPAPIRTPKQATAPVPAAENSGLFAPVPPPSNPKIRGGVAIAVSGASAAKSGAPAVVSTSALPSSSATINNAGKALGFAPIEPPPSPVSVQQQAELQLLLSRYMANQITPEEYQKERAAILGKR